MTWHRRFFWLLILFLPTQLGVHFWPEWAMVLGRRVDYLSPTLFFTDILIALTVGAYIIFNFRAVAKAAMARRRQFSIFNKFSKPTVIFLLFIAFNIFFAVNRPVAIYKWVKVAEFAMLGWYIVRTKPSLSLVIFPLSLGMFYSSLLAIGQFVFQRSVGGPLWFLGERTFDVMTPGIARFDFNFSLFTFHFSLFGLRPYATFPHPNVLGGFLAAVLPLVIIPLSKTKKIYSIGVVLLGFVALLLTFSRSAIVTGAVVIAFAVARIKKPFLLYSLFFILLFAIIATIDVREESVVVRGQLNAAAVKLWQTSPSFGVGLGNFLVRLPEVLPTRTVYFLQPVHNIYLLLLSEVGIVGIGLIVLWIANRLNYEFRIKNYGKGKRIDLFFIHNSLFVILFLGLLDHYPLTLQQGQLLFTILAAESLAWVH